MLFFLLFATLAQDIPDGPGKELVLKQCRDCHDLDTVISENRTKDAWRKTLVKMGDRGAEMTDEQFEVIVNYLARNFGRVNVNKATAEEIASGLGFSAKESQAIVVYRGKNGTYADWQELKKVMDAAKGAR